jgi:trimeric autotransporter adhesin
MPNTQVTNRAIANSAITGVKLNVLTTKGDLMVYDTVADREAVGTDGQVLFADSTQATGVRWGNNIAVAMQSLSSDPGSPLAGTIWLNTTNNVPKVDSAYGIGAISNTLYVNSATSASVTNTTTETLFNQNFTVLASKVAVGTTFRIKAFGAYTNTAANTFTFKCKLGSAIVLSSGSLTAVNGSNKQWTMEAYLTITSTGSSGSLNGGGDVAINDGNFTALASSGVGVNTTTNNALGVSIQWGSALTTSTISLAFLVVEILN